MRMRREGLQASRGGMQLGQAQRDEQTVELGSMIQYARGCGSEEPRD